MKDMRLIDAAALYEQTAEWEARALEQVERYIGWETMDDPDYQQWKHWTTVLNERTAFKFDVADAPTIEAEPVRHGKWIDETDEPWGSVYDPFKCGLCGCNTNRKYAYCPNCGAKMEE